MYKFFGVPIIVFLLTTSSGTTAESTLLKPDLVIATDPLGKCCDEVCSVAFSPDGSTVAAKLYHSDRRGNEGIVLWDVTKGGLLGGLDFAPSGVYSIKFAPSGKVVALQNGRMCDVNNGNIVSVGSPDDRIYSIAFSPDGKVIASSDGKTADKITLWDATTRQKLRVLNSDVRTGKELSFSEDGALLVSSGINHLQFFSVETGQLLGNITPECGEFTQFAYKPGSAVIAVTECGGSSDNSIELVNASTARSIARLEGHTSVIWSLDLSSDNRLLASSSQDLTIKLWDTLSGRLIRTFSGHSKIVRTVKFSPDSLTIVSGGGDNEVKLWSVTSGELIATFRPFKDGNWIVFTPDGFYTRSPGASKYVSWRMNGKLFEESVFQRQFLQPGIVAERLGNKR